MSERDVLLAAIADWEVDADACAQQRDDLRARLDRIRAAAESDADLAGFPALRSFLLREAAPGVMHVPGVKTEARQALLDLAALPGAAE